MSRLAYRYRRHLYALGSLAMIIALITCLPSRATRLAPDLAKFAAIAIGGKVRLDGSMETKDGQLYLLLVPANKDQKKNAKIEIDSEFPNAKQPDIVFYSNGWAHIRTIRRGDASTIAYKNLPEKLRKRVNSLRFASDLIVPQGFVLGRSLKAMVQDVPSIALIDDEVLYSPDFGMKRKTSAANYHGPGSIFLTSITSGSITMLDGRTLEKIAEFPTEGTPCSMELANGELFIADEAKSRILELDPIKRTFIGQIDLPEHSAPKGLAALPSGQWVYVSESGSGDVAAVDITSGKTLLKTKVHPGPGPLALTPDGTLLLVLNVTSGELTMISTFNQRIAGTVRVGDMPTAIAVSRDGKMAYVANRISNTVSIVDIGQKRVIGTIKCGQGPTAVLLSSDGTKLYVATGRDNTITEYDCLTQAKIHDLHFSSDMEFPGCMCMLPGGKRFLVLSESTDEMAEVDTDSLEMQNHISLGHANHVAMWAPVP